METMMHIGAKLDKETADNASNAIEQILKAGFEYRSSDKVLLKSLDVLKAAVTVQNVSVSGCTFDNDQSKKVIIEVPSDYTTPNSSAVEYKL